MDTFNLLTGEEEYAARIASLPKTVLQYQFLAANNSKVIVQYKLYSYMLNRIDCIYSLYCFTKNVIDKMFFFLKNYSIKMQRKEEDSALREKPKV